MEASKKVATKISRFFIKKLNPEAVLPKKGSLKAAGYDICSIEDVVIPAQGKGKVSTGICFMIP